MLVYDWKDTVGRYIVNESCFRKINDVSCEVTMNFYFDHIDEKYVGIVLAEIIHGYLMLSLGYNIGKSSVSNA